jgi:oligopeptidase A
MNEILALRDALAKLLGFANYAELSLATKMAKSPDEVLKFLWDLVEQCQQRAKQELNELREFAKDLSGIEDFSVWDSAYFSEKLKAKYFSFSEEDIRPYFPENVVLSGLFALSSRLFGITIQEEPITHSWHPSVRLFSVTFAGEIIAYFYLDLYARFNKRSGAWMDECQIRRRTQTGEIQKPIAYLICNFNQPTSLQPSLLSHDEVMTLFHEFGHGLQHLLTKIEVAGVSGIQGIAWDAVELPSQFMEHWCWDFETIELISSHFQTQAKLPKDLFEKMTAARNFQSSMQLLRQLEYSLFDFHLHAFYNSEQPEFIQNTLDTLRQKFSLLPVPKFNRFQHSFSHIFGGSYAAGYYSYLWAEVLACDAFAKFAEQGYINQVVGQQFRDTILALGGSKDAEEVFYEFRGRKPSMDALLIYRGITRA